MSLIVSIRNFLTEVLTESSSVLGVSAVTATKRSCLLFAYMVVNQQLVDEL